VIEGVGGRLALDWDGVLYSTAFSVFGGATERGGVKTAVLNRIGVVSTEPAKIAVGVGPSAVEPFKINYRVVPPDIEVESAELEFVVGDVVVRTDIAPQPSTTGSISYESGFAFQQSPNEPPRVRLVANRGLPQEVPSRAKALRLVPFKLRFVPADDEEPTTADDESVAILATNRALVERSLSGSLTPPMLRLRWSPGSASLLYLSSQFDNDGIFINNLFPGTDAGTSHFANAKIGDIDLGTPDPFILEPGAAAQIELTTSRNKLPSDGQSEVQITATIKDAHGNLVPDGTPMTWEAGALEEVLGSFSTSFSETEQGRVSVTYRAAETPGLVPVILGVDGIRDTVVIEQERLDFTVTADPPAFDPDAPVDIVLTAQVITPTGQFPKDGVQIDWLQFVGTIVSNEPLVSGTARAVLRPDPVALYSNLGSIVIHARIGRNSGVIGIPRVDIAPQPRAELDSLVMSGVRSMDAVIDIPDFDGESREAFIKASNAVTITGLNPGESVSVQLGSSRYPNVRPLLWYPLNSLSGGTTPELFGREPALVQGGAIDSEDRLEGDGSFLADGSSSVRMPSGLASGVSSDFQVAAGIKPSVSVAASIADRAGVFRLQLVPDAAGVHHHALQWYPDAKF
jgi:hypothetical protein